MTTSLFVGDIKSLISQLKELHSNVLKAGFSIDGVVVTSSIEGIYFSATLKALTSEQIQSEATARLMESVDLDDPDWLRKLLDLMPVETIEEDI